MTDFLNLVESAASEVPEIVGTLLKAMGDQIAHMGEMLEALAARMDKLDPPTA